MPSRLHPLCSFEAEEHDRPIVIDDAIAFGRPVVARRCMATSAIVDRIDAGEEPRAVADDYDLDLEDAVSAVVHERAGAVPMSKSAVEDFRELMRSVGVLPKEA